MPHVRWEPAAGEVRHFFDDEPVPGTRGISQALLRGVEPFPTAELTPYNTAFLSGCVVEHYQLLDAAEDAQDRMRQNLRGLMRIAGPGRYAPQPADPAGSRGGLSTTCSCRCGC